MNEIEREFKSKGNISKNFTIPLLFWEEWQEDCKTNFNNTYHLKMQFDHEFTKSFQFIANQIMKELAELNARIEQLEERKEENKVNKTFG